MTDLDADLVDILEDPSDSDADISAFLDAPADSDHDFDAAIVVSPGLQIDAAPSRPILDASSEALIMRLQDLQAPACFIKLLHRILHVCPVEQRLTHAEYFAGVKEVTAAHQRAGHVAASFELLDGHDESQNMLSNIGFVNACRMSCGVIDGGASTSAPVCSSFVFMNCATAKRNFCFPLGDEEVPSVAAANIMVARVLLLQWIFMCRMIFCVLEQPASSWMQYHDQFQEFLRIFPLWRHSVNMGDFGADSQKSSWLYSSHACISHVDFFESTMVAATKKKLATTGVNGTTGKKTVMQPHERFEIEPGIHSSVCMGLDTSIPTELGRHPWCGKSCRTSHPSCASGKGPQGIAANGQGLPVVEGCKARPGLRLHGCS